MIIKSLVWIKSARSEWQTRLRARSIQPIFQPVRPGKEDHLKMWTRFFETFPVGPNRSTEFWTEISGNFDWMDRALIFRRSKRQIYRTIVQWPTVIWSLALKHCTRRYTCTPVHTSSLPWAKPFYKPAQNFKWLAVNLSTRTELNHRNSTVREKVINSQHFFFLAWACALRLGKKHATRDSTRGA